jgi:hypothetical protein
MRLGDLPGLLLGPFHQVLDRLDLGVGFDDECEGHDLDVADRRDALDGVMRPVRVDVRADAQGTVRAHHERVPVGLGTESRPGADQATRPGPVLDDHGLTEDFADERRNEACRHVHVAAGRKRHNDADRLAGKALRPPRLRSERKRSEYGGDDSSHFLFPPF